MKNMVPFDYLRYGYLTRRLELLTIINRQFRIIIIPFRVHNSDDFSRFSYHFTLLRSLLYVRGSFVSTDCIFLYVDGNRNSEYFVVLRKSSVALDH